MATVTSLAGLDERGSGLEILLSKLLYARTPDLNLKHPGNEKNRLVKSNAIQIIGFIFILLYCH